MSRVLVVSHEPVGRLLAGPALRSVEIARALSVNHDVAVAAPAVESGAVPDLSVVEYRFENLAEIVADYDAAIVSGLTFNFAPGLRALGVPLVLDLFIPIQLEELQARSADSIDRQREHQASLLDAIYQQLQGGDFFLCASERQRDFWLGALAAAGRLTPDAYRVDATFRSLIDIVEFGIPNRAPEPKAGILKGGAAPFASDDVVLYWGGGLYDWFDPLSLVDALARLHRSGKTNVKLFFSGVRHPNPDVKEMRIVGQTRRKVTELGLDDSVIFNEWVPYQERGAYLLEADVGVSLHLAHIETRFSVRTRLLDYIWSGIPMVLTAGDTLSQELADAGVARLVEENDVMALVDAIESESAADRRAQLIPAFEELRARFRWSKVVEPLDAFCLDPRRAPDSVAENGRGGGGTNRFSKALGRVRRGQLVALVDDVRDYVTWRYR